MNRLSIFFLLFSLFVVGRMSVATAEVTFDFVTVGNAGNSADPETGLGEVAQPFMLATTEVTFAQYTEFLNAVAATDDFGGADPHLYDPQMATFDTSLGGGSPGGILRSGTPGAYAYQVIMEAGDRGDRSDYPVVYVSFIDAMRFVNWLHNGQGSGDTESGAYEIAVDNPANGTVETRSFDATYFLPNQNQWYKAAYHQPADMGGDVDDFWLYPTSSNDIPDRPIDPNPQAHYGGLCGILANAFCGTEVVGIYDPNFYGLFDMAGNVSEWNEFVDSASRGGRGGSWDFTAGPLQSTSANTSLAITGSRRIGIRVARKIPCQFASDDIGQFVIALLTDSEGDEAICAFDRSMNGRVDGDDIQLFVSALID